MFIHPQICEVSLDWTPGPIHSTGPNIPTNSIENKFAHMKVNAMSIV